MIEYVRENLIPWTETLSPYGKAVAVLNRWYRTSDDSDESPPGFIMKGIISDLEKISLDGKEIAKLLQNLGIIPNGFDEEMKKGIETACNIFNQEKSSE